MSDLVFIYTLAHPITGEVRYVGKAVNLIHRLKNHIKEKLNTRKCNWIKSLTAQGLKPKIEALECFYDAQDWEWSEAERFWIESLRHMGCRLTNVERGGYGGGPRSKETREKISAAHKGKTLTLEHRAKLSLAARNPTPETRLIRSRNQIGRKYSEETKLKLSNLRKGKYVSPEHIAKIVAKTRGLKRTDEFRKRCSERMTGRKISEATKLKMSISHKARFAMKNEMFQTVKRTK
jgi:group I intron endonuclease